MSEEIVKAALAAAAEAGATYLPIVSRDYTHATVEELALKIEGLEFTIQATLKFWGELFDLFENRVNMLEKNMANIIDHISRTRILPSEAGEKEL